MIIARLIGHVWATRKYDSMEGKKLMLTEVITGTDKGKQIVAVDELGAGIGDRVVLAMGSTAQNYLNEERDQVVPVDAIVVGIIDEDCQIGGE